jgi:hypothetical protein
MALALALLLQALPSAATVESVTLQRSGEHEELVILFSRETAVVTVRQEGNRVVVETTATLAADLAPPPPIGGLVQEVHMESAGAGPAHVSLRMADGITYETERNGRTLRVRFGRSATPSPMSDVYGMLFPGGAEVVDPETAVVNSDDEMEPSGYILGPTAVRPSADVLLSSGNSSFAEGPVPAKDTYVEARPRIDTTTRLGLADLTLAYELRWRTGSDFEETNTASHLLDAGLNAPLGTRFLMSATHHHFWGRAEAFEADPGGEFFYSHEPFRKHMTSGNLAVEIGPVTKLVANGFYWHVDFDSPTSQFFDYERYGGSLAVRRELGPSLTADLGVGWEKVPSPDRRPIAAATARNLRLLLRGEPTARLIVDASLALERRTTPSTPLEGDPFDLAMSVGAEYVLTAASTLKVDLGRNRYVSAYEQNPYYTSQFARLTLHTTALPLQLQAEGAVGLQSNTYPVPSLSLGAAREDTIVGWSASLVRTLDKLYARLDYTWSRRRSNVPDQSFRTNALIVTVGFHPYPDAHGGSR